MPNMNVDILDCNNALYYKGTDLAGEIRRTLAKGFDAAILLDGIVRGLEQTQGRADTLREIEGHSSFDKVQKMKTGEPAPS